MSPSNATGSKRMKNRMSRTIGPIPISSFSPYHWARNSKQPQSCSSPLMRLLVMAAMKIAIIQSIIEALIREKRSRRSMVPHSSSQRETRSATAGMSSEGRIWYSAMTRAKYFRSRSFSPPERMNIAPSSSLRVVINAEGKLIMAIGVFLRFHCYGFARLRFKQPHPSIGKPARDHSARPPEKTLTFL